MPLNIFNTYPIFFYFQFYSRGVLPWVVWGIFWYLKSEKLIFGSMSLRLNYVDLSQNVGIPYMYVYVYVCHSQGYFKRSFAAKTLKSVVLFLWNNIMQIWTEMRVFKVGKCSLQQSYRSYQATFHFRHKDSISKRDPIAIHGKNNVWWIYISLL